MESFSASQLGKGAVGIEWLFCGWRLAMLAGPVTALLWRFAFARTILAFEVFLVGILFTFETTTKTPVPVVPARRPPDVDRSGFFFGFNGRRFAFDRLSYFNSDGSNRFIVGEPFY